MSVQHTATTSLLAVPTVEASPDQSFSVVAKGYHRGEVDEWARWALSEIEGLTRRVTTLAGHAASSPEGQRLIADLLQIAADELTGQKQAAIAEIEQMIAGAREQADQILAEARAEADRAIGGATQQAGTLVNGARAEAKKITDEAAARAAAVNEAAGERLAHLVKIHEDGIARLAQVNKVTADVLNAEQGRGPLQAEVDKVLAPVRRLFLLVVDVRAGARLPAAVPGVVHEAALPVLPEPAVNGSPVHPDPLLRQDPDELHDADAVLVRGEQIPHPDLRRVLVLVRVGEAAALEDFLEPGGLAVPVPGASCGEGHHGNVQDAVPLRADPPLRVVGSQRLGG